LCIARQKTDVDSVIQMATLLADWAQTGKIRSMNAVNEDVSPEGVPV
jgi:hypothetical protein